jgi:hypothetical protein
MSDNEPLSHENFRDVTAVVRTVSLDDYIGLSADERLQDLAWVGPKALRHEQVIEEVMQYSPVLPARFGTLFSTRDSLLELVENNYVEIDRFLTHISDKEEWAVKCAFSRSSAKKRLLDEKLAVMSENLQAMAPGLRYFKERQITAEVDKGLSRWLAGVCGAVERELKALSADSEKRSVIKALEDGTMEVVANWAFLVNEYAVQTFEAAIVRWNEKLSEQGIILKCSGPWPPYTFSPTLEMEPGS